MAIPQKTYLKDYTIPGYLCREVDLHFDIQAKYTAVTARLSLHVNPQLEQKPGPLVLDGEGLSLQRLAIDGALLPESAYTLTETALTIGTVPTDFTLETCVHIDPANNTALSGLYLSNGNYCTQCESQGFRRITYFLDRPDVLSYYSVSIAADRKHYPYLLSNGHLTQQRILADGRRWVKWQDPCLKPCYLFALVAGDFDERKSTFVTQSNRQVQIHFYVEKGFIEQVPYAMESLKQAMAWDEQAYGREYDLDLYMVVAVSDFNFGAMENKGLNIFNTKYVLAHQLTAIDQDYLNIRAVIGHEYFHNWSGNRVTCRDWFQISLKEGLTVFREHTFMSNIMASAVQRISEVALIRNRQFAEDKGPMSHPVRPDSYIEINNFYTLTVYHKGAELIRMMSLLLGSEDYRKGTDLYFERHDGQAVTTEDFVAAMEAASDQDLTQFRLWYETAGTPSLTVTEAFDADQQCYTLTFNQAVHGDDHVVLHIPVVLGLLSSSTGAELSFKQHADDGVGVNETMLAVTEREQSFSFYGITERPVPSILRGFSAPVQVMMDRSDEDLSLLFIKDTDPVNQWDAGQQLATRAILAHGTDQFEPYAARLKDTFEKILAQPVADFFLLGNLLALPAESFLIQQHCPCDIDLIVAGRLALKHYLASALESTWMVQYHDHLHQKDYSAELSEIARRCFKNLCLDYLLTQDKDEFLDLGLHQFMVTDNLTDRLAAVNGLRDHDSDQRTTVLEKLYDLGHGQPLVLDRWFQVQAESRLPDALKQVQALLKHADFSWQNPNRVRSLVASFCMNNYPVFHHASGDGYRFLATIVAQLDTINPQTAARLLEPLTQGAQYDAARAQLMQQALQGLAKKDLSKGVYEVVNRSLTK